MNTLLINDLTYKIIGACMEVHRLLGHGFREVVYKDAIEVEATLNDIRFCREKKFEVHYKQVLLSHPFFADFIVEDNVILEVKAAEGPIIGDQIAQTLNYLKASGCKIGLIVNFGRRSLEDKRLIF